MLSADICMRALGARDPRFDGLFFVGITSTRVYCRPVCPARVSYPDRRRFFDSAAAAEGAGFRPCLRCRPELAPGRALCDAVPRLAHVAAHRIASGALNGRTVADLAGELGVSERHLRRALEREIGVSPLDLAQTHRLLLAKQLLADTRLSVTRVAYASGFQSLRRFNTVFRERYRMSPSALRRTPRAAGGAGETGASRETAVAEGSELLRLTLAYRAPLAWETLLAELGREAMPGVEVVQGRRYARTVTLDGRTGVVFAQDAPQGEPGRAAARHGARSAHLAIDVSPALLPDLMPLLARLRQLFDLDAEPAVVDAHLRQGGLGERVRSCPGLRVPGAFDGFEVALRVMLGRARRGSGGGARDLARRVVDALGDPIDTGVVGLTRIGPDAVRVADAGVSALVALGVPAARAEAIEAVARQVVRGTLRLEPGSDVGETHSALLGIDGVGHRSATAIVRRSLHWPDAFAATDRALQRAAGASGAAALLETAEKWRPWRAYAASHLQLARRQH